MVKLNEETIKFLEEHIPEISATAIKQAYWDALSSGSTVLISKGGSILEVSPDGSLKEIKKIAPSIATEVGQTFIIK